MRITILDKHLVSRLGMLAALEGHQCVECSEPDASLVTASNPELVILEIHGLGRQPLHLVTALSGTRVLIHSLSDNPTYIARAKALGAWGYILKGPSVRELVEAVKAAEAGKPYPGLLAETGDLMAKRKREPDCLLTARETQVVRHLALGLSNREIATSLGISIETVKEHVQHLLRKLNCEDRTQAAVWAVRQGLVPND